MRIGFITGEYPPMQGGVGDYTHLLARHLRSLGHEVFIYSDQRAESRAEIPLESAVKRWDIGAFRRAKVWASRNQLDIISLQYQTAAYAMSPVVHFAPELLRPFPVVTTFHDLRYPYLFPKAGRVREWIVRRLARASSGVIVTNHEDRQTLTESGIESTLIPIGSNIFAAFSDMSDGDWVITKLGDPFTLVFFGLINRSKGIDILLRSIRLLLDENLPIRLRIVGGGTGSSDSSNIDYAKEIETLIDQLQLRPYVTETGYLDDDYAAAEIRDADLVVLPFLDGASFRRGTLMAALHFSAAILTTTPRVHIPEFNDIEAMMFAQPNDPADLAAQIRAAYYDYPLRDRLHLNAGKLGNKFDWTQIARDTAAYFARVLEHQA